MIPTYVVIPVRDRHEMLANLLRQLVEQDPTWVIVLDNESDPPQPETDPPVATFRAPGKGVFEMWNAGLEMAEGHARASGHNQWNVAVLNSDVSIPANWLALVGAGLRALDNVGIAYSDIYGVPYGQVAEAVNDSMTGQTFSGWAWMTAGELGLRCDTQFDYWYGDSDLEATARKAGLRIVCVGGTAVEHLDASGHVLRERHRLEQAKADEARYAAKWGLDPSTLFLALNPEFGKDAA